MNKKILADIAAASLLISTGMPLQASTDQDTLQFFEQEAQVLSASRLPSLISLAPATVYVITAADIKASGMRNIWDILRQVPGVDVVQSRTSQADVSIRGLDQPLNNRTLVLLNGHSARIPTYDYVQWEQMPVSLDEIDRIEIVEGPASTVYGGNAMNGVINIITKSPQQFRGGVVSYRGGEHGTEDGDFAYGKQHNNFGYKMGAGHQSTNHFDASNGHLASQNNKFNGAFNYETSKYSRWDFSWGWNHLDSELNTGGLWVLPGWQDSASVSVSYTYKDIRIKTYWDHGHSLYQFPAFSQPTTYLPWNLTYNSYEMELEQTLSLPWNNKAVVGGTYRKNTDLSNMLAPSYVSEDLWALYGEDRWDIAEKWVLSASARLDRHPLTPLAFSPRGSITYTPIDGHALRFSAGTSFRNPTLIENHANLSGFYANLPTPTLRAIIPNPPITTIAETVVGDTKLSPERMSQEEIAYIAQWGRIKATATGFHYRINNIITADGSVTGFSIPTLPVTINFLNFASIETWGAEFGTEAVITRWLTGTANYSYQYLHDLSSGLSVSMQSPRHKANAGIQIKNGGFTGTISSDWVDKTNWRLQPVNAYFLVNAHAGYAFSGRWSGLEVGASAFNLLNHTHYEIAPSTSGNIPVVNPFAGERIGQNWTGTISYRF